MNGWGIHVNRLMLAGLLLSILAAIPSAAAALSMDGWIAAVHHQCPTHHLEWYCDGCWDEIYDTYESNLPMAAQKKVLATLDYGPCKDEFMGLSCEMAANILAIGRAGLFNDFVSWSCAHFTCEDAAICSKIPTRHHKP